MRKLSAILFTTVLLAGCLEAGARKQRTTRGAVGRRAVTVDQVSAAPKDTFLLPDSGEIHLYGYDKPLRSRRETVFVSNNTDVDIKAVAITTQYIDSKGRMFHEVRQRVAVDLPAHAMRKVDFKSWDTQQSFYYVGSKRSRSAGTPYSVRQSVDTVFVAL